VGGQPVPALAPFAVDQLGCGDALLAAATLCVSVQMPLAVAALIGSVAAASQARRLGNAVIGASDLRQGMRRLSGAQLAWSEEPNAVLTPALAL
jgi:sugar/nucleoside kinase (ribokinase family)